MIKRYSNEEISRIWGDPYKFRLWQKTELAVIKAQCDLGNIDPTIYDFIFELLERHEIDIAWLEEREKATMHDLNAFVDERLRHLPSHLQSHFHNGMTSYDTEEPAFAKMLSSSYNLVYAQLIEIQEILENLAGKYRYTIMMARTHGQPAELQSFGKRCLGWYKSIEVCRKVLENAEENLYYSKLSGAIGNYGGLEPEVEAKALEILGLKPFYGATQIMPRSLYAPLGQALCQLVQELDNIALSIRLGARPGHPILQEPFGKKQKGSSRMPHKKNTISTEQMEGMSRMAQGYLLMITANIRTWEERAIEQSCVERVAWPDLFHVVMHSLKIMTNVLQNLTVYLDNMLLEIIETRGCYTSGGIKDFLRQEMSNFGLTTEDAYRMVQLAAFNVFEADPAVVALREKLPQSFSEAEGPLNRMAYLAMATSPQQSIKFILLDGQLRCSKQLETGEADVQKWNSALKKLFEDPKKRTKLELLFSPAYLLQNEDTLYKQILGE